MAKKNDEAAESRRGSVVRISCAVDGTTHYRLKLLALQRRESVQTLVSGWIAAKVARVTLPTAGDGADDAA